MDKSRVELLLQFMFGKMTFREFKELRSNIRKSSDEEIRPVMETLWEDERMPSPVPMDTRLRVLTNLHRHSQTASSYLYWLKTASVILLPLLLAWGTYSYLSRHDTHPYPTDMKVATSSGQKVQINLPDGSKVWLNSKSSLHYPADFGIRDRTVRLKGEGYFEVAKDETKQFSVQTDEVNVVVHGTKFNISAHEGKPEIRVSLLEGSLSVENKEHRLLDKLTPLHTMEIRRGDLGFHIIREDTHLASLWSQHKCRMENASAEEVFKQMGYWYGLNIRVENINTDYRYGFTIKEESFREFLEFINELTPLEYSINGEEVIVRYK